MAVHLGVIGPSDASPELRRVAAEVGRRAAAAGAVVFTGGLGGVMAAASRGAADSGGLTVGLLPGLDRAAANPWVRLAIPTGLGELRNGLLVRSCDALVAVGCSWGTLSEVALAVRTGVPIVAVDCWELPDGPVPAASAEAALAILAELRILSGAG